MTEVRLPYADRREAGRLLAQRLEGYRGQHELLVLGLPRGGVPVACEVAHGLQAPMDVFIVRKLGHPAHEEYAIGAIASGGVRVLNPEIEVPPEAVERVADRELMELRRRERLYRGDRPALALAGHTVIVVDDGLATGSTMRAAVTAIRLQHPAHLVVAVPVGAAQTCQMLRREVDELVCPAMPEPFRAVGLWYRDFPQTTDDEVYELLEAARRGHALETH
ncbi:MAG TPA: phosphoribosyltransferase [Ramlibacter sp.]|nr:phosphoribosyltransferase [Ramlibacter sp.]